MATIRKRAWRTVSGEARESWQVDFVDQQGKRRHKQFSRKKDADLFLVTARGQVVAGTYTADSASPTVAEAARLWLERCEQDGLERSTMVGYRSHVKYHIEPLIGSEKLSRLTTPRVEQFRDDLLSGERSRALAKKVLGSMKALLKEAQRRGLVAQNVARDVTIRTNGRHKKRGELGRDIPLPDEIRQLLATVTGCQRPLLVTAVFTGLRSSELRGLVWEHVEFDAKVIRVRQRADAWGVIGPLKSATSRRDIPMSPLLVNTLREWKLACPRRGVQMDKDGNVIDAGELVLVFPNGAGNVESHANIWNRLLAPLEVAAGVAEPVLDAEGKPVLEPVLRGGRPVLVNGEPDLRVKMWAKYGLHSFRHFFASWLIDQGFGPKRVQTLMGHSSIQVTFDIYGHLFPQEDDHDRFAAGELALVG